MAIANTIIPARDTRALLIKWIVGLLVPLAVFTFIWSGEAIINQFNVMYERLRNKTQGD